MQGLYWVTTVQGLPLVSQLKGEMNGKCETLQEGETSIFFARQRQFDFFNQLQAETSKLGTFRNSKTQISLKKENKSGL